VGRRCPENAAAEITQILLAFPGVGAAALRSAGRRLGRSPLADRIVDQDQAAQPALRLTLDEIQRLHYAQRPASQNVITNAGGAQEIFHVGHASRGIVSFVRDLRLSLRAGIECQNAELLAQCFELQTEHRGRHQPTGNEHNGLLAAAGFKVMQAQSVAIVEEPAADRRGQGREAHHAANEKGQDMAESHTRQRWSASRQRLGNSRRMRIATRGFLHSPDSALAMPSSMGRLTQCALGCVSCMFPPLPQMYHRPCQ